MLKIMQMAIFNVVALMHEERSLVVIAMCPSHTEYLAT
jgi:hypothetical protein